VIKHTKEVIQPPDDLERARYARMRWNAPLSVDHADLLLDRLDVSVGVHVLDLGCGWGEFLLRAVARGGTSSGAVTTGTGVDIDVEALERGRARAAELSLNGQATFVTGEAASWREPADRVLCIGASHAWHGTREALLALTGLVRPGGRLLFGDSCWERPPTEEAAALFGEDTLALELIVENAVATGWRVVHLSTADQREWDDFEATWRSGRQEWLRNNPHDDRAAEVRDTLNAQLREYLSVYRGVLGFCYLILGR
jgi:cyclopropane fatty-acyl-phospholipid synthase-like methyltransferase